MTDRKLSLVTLMVKTLTVHTVTYFPVGLLAFFVLDYRRWFAEPQMQAVMRQTDDLWVMAGPLFQPIRGLLFAVAFYPLREVLFARKDGWRVLWLELVILGILSPFGASPGSIEGMIYTNWPTTFHVLALPEVFLQAFLLSVVLHYWVRHPEQRWLSWTLGILLFLVLLLPALGLLTRQGQRDQRKACNHPGDTTTAGELSEGDWRNGHGCPYNGSAEVACLGLCGTARLPSGAFCTTTPTRDCSWPGGGCLRLGGEQIADPMRLVLGDRTSVW
jgi:hypothetical protein